jgi:hypothetical protein
MSRLGKKRLALWVSFWLLAMYLTPVAAMACEGGGGGTPPTISPGFPDQYGKVKIGSKMEHTYTVKNTTAVTYKKNIFTKHFGTGFSLVSTTCEGVFAANMWCNVKIKFEPTAENNASSELQIPWELSPTETGEIAGPAEGEGVK